MSKMNGKRIERRLRRILGENLVRINRRRGVGVQRQRTQHASHIHNPRGCRLAQQRQKGLGQPDGAKEIRLECLQ